MLPTITTQRQNLKEGLIQKSPNDAHAKSSPEAKKTNALGSTTLGMIGSFFKRAPSKSDANSYSLMK
jgi:hypothetical protein